MATGTVQNTPRGFRVIELTDGPVEYTVTRRVCKLCKHNHIRVKTMGVDPIHHYFCGAVDDYVQEAIFMPIPEGTRYIGQNFLAPDWCPRMNNLVDLEGVVVLGEDDECI